MLKRKSPDNNNNNSHNDDNRNDNCLPKEITFIPNSIATLDPKKVVTFFETQPSNSDHEDIISARFHRVNSHTVWEINSFLTQSECEQIIKASEKSKFDPVLYGKSRSRLLAFDSNGNLVKTLQERLKCDSFLDRLNSKRNLSVPYGFKSHHKTWEPNGPEINPCIRVNKYASNKSSIGWHRDAQYTESETAKSNYTVLVYLNT